MLFKPVHIAPILSGEKTQTRRLWKRWPVKEGGVYQCQTKLYDNGSVFARIRVLRRWEERLGDISEADAKAEMCESKEEYLALFNRINGKTFDPGIIVKAIEFVLER